MSSGNSDMCAKNCNIGVMMIGDGEFRARDINVTSNTYYSTPEESDNIFVLPPLIETFAGREEEIEELLGLLFSNDGKREIPNKVVICGLSGIGKSEFAKQFAKKCQDEGRVQEIYWISIENENDLEKSLAKMYKKSKGKKCIIILDNAVSRLSLAKYNLSDEYIFLITSRVKNWGRGMVSIPLEPLNLKFALEFYKIFLQKDYSQHDEDLYIKIANFIGCMPLGLQITAAYIFEEKSKSGTKFLQTYVEKLEQSEYDIITEILPESADVDYNKSLHGTIKVSLGKITSEIRYVLYVCCYLSAESVWVEDLLDIVKLDKNWDENKLRDILSSLANYSLIHFNPDNGYLATHRFTQKMLRFHFSKYEREITYNCCYKVCLEAAFKKQSISNLFNIFLPTFQLADENLSTFINCYKEHAEEIAKDNCNILLLNKLIKYGCINSVKVIFEYFSVDYAKSILTESHLLEDTINYNQFGITDTLLSFISVDNKNTCYNKLMHHAASTWNFNALIFLKTQGAQFSGKDEKGNTVLFNLISAPNPFNIDFKEIEKFFSTLETEQYKNYRNDKNETLLHASIDSLSVDLIELLISKYNINVNDQDMQGRTCLHKLVQKNIDNDIGRAAAKLLIMHGTSLDIKNKENKTALEYNSNLVKYLNKFIFYFNNCITGYKNNTHLLHYNVILNHLDKLELNLVKYDISVDSEDENKNTPLHVAAFTWNKRAMEVLVNHKATLNARNKDGITPLYYFILSARYRGYISMYEVNIILRLLTVDENKNNINNIKETFIHCALASLHPELIELFLTKDNVNVKDSHHNTPLHSFISQLIVLKDDYVLDDDFNDDLDDHPDDDTMNTKLEKKLIILKIFKLNGSDLHLKNAVGVTPIELAQRNELNHVVIYLLLENKYVDQLEKILKDVHNSASYINTLHLLHYSVYDNQLEVLKHLLTYDGIKIDNLVRWPVLPYSTKLYRTYRRSTSPLHLAAYTSNLQAIQLLIQNGANKISFTTGFKLYEFFKEAYYSEHINLNEVIEISRLLGLEILISRIDSDDITDILHLAVKSLHADLVTFLVNNYHININMAGQGKTALHVFIEQIAKEDINDQKKLTRMRNTAVELMSLGASLTIKDIFDMTPIQVAQFMKVDHILIFLLFKDKYKDHLRNILEKLDDDDITKYITQYGLLQSALEQYQLMVLNLLLQYSKKDQKETLLHIATSNCNLEAIKILINEHNADSSVKNSCGNIPLHDLFIGARSREYIDLDVVNEILQLLHCKNYKNILNNKNETLMHAAAYSLHADLVDILRCKINVNALDSQHNTIHSSPHCLQQILEKRQMLLRLY